MCVLLPYICHGCLFGSNGSEHHEHDVLCSCLSPLSSVLVMVYYLLVCTCSVVVLHLVVCHVVSIYPHSLIMLLFHEVRALLPMLVPE